MLNQIEGLHHVTSMASGARANNAFFTGALGLRRVKKTVNFDAPDVYHLYYGDAAGTPGSVMTYFPFRNIGDRKRGTGEVGLTRFAVPEGSLPFWAERLARAGVEGLKSETTFGEERLLCASRDSLRSSSRPWYVPIHLGDRLAVRQGAALLPVEDAARAAPGGPQFWQDELAAGLLDELACVDGKLAVDGTRTLRTVTALSDVLAAGPLTLVYRFDDAAVDVTTAEPDRSLARLRRHLGPLGRTLAHTAEAGP